MALATDFIDGHPDDHLGLALADEDRALDLSSVVAISLIVGIIFGVLFALMVTSV